jgi:hypothetical protein
MATVRDILKSINAYPIPENTLAGIAVVRGIDLDSEATAEVLNSATYRLAKADVMVWLSSAPNITQEGISYSLLLTVQQELCEAAEAIYAELNPQPEQKSKYGYKGTRL